ncbi:MAG: 2-dehydropantoate 2-reductase [Pseudomonadota bacterium]
MRILVVGAGALGGYFGGRLLEAGKDVTFLLRERRLAQLQQTGLVIRSSHGDVVLPAPPAVLAAELDTPFDVVIVGCKAYDLEATMDSFAPAVGPQTMVIPLLNGLRQLDILAARFGAGKVLGGFCMISGALGADGSVQHLNDSHTLSFGERDGSLSPRVLAFQAVCAGARFDAVASATILQEMWEKWTFIAAAAGITCLLRGTVGDIVASGNAGLATGLFEECAAIAARNGFANREAALARSRKILTTAGSPMTASMLKDIERGGPVEADHVVGDLLGRAGPGGEQRAPLLRVAYGHLKAYEARRTREAAAVPAT